jgi:hypothetical protein
MTDQKAFDTKVSDLEQSLINYAIVSATAVTKRSPEQATLFGKAEEYIRLNFKEAIELEIRDDIHKINARKLNIAELNERLDSPDLKPKPFPSEYAHNAVSNYVVGTVNTVMELYSILERVTVVTEFIDTRYDRIKAIVRAVLSSHEKTEADAITQLIIPSDIARTLQYHKEIEEIIKLRIKAFEYADSQIQKLLKINVDAVQKNL